MSRLYKISFSADHHDPTRVEAIEDAINDQLDWGMGDIDVNGENIQGVATASLYAGESEDEFATRLACAIWEANEAFCPVDVETTYLEDLPEDVDPDDLNPDYTRPFDKAAYTKMTGKAT